MEYCSSCPYPAKCDNRGRCLTGKEVKAAAPVVEEKPKPAKKKGLK